MVATIKPEEIRLAAARAVGVSEAASAPYADKKAWIGFDWAEKLNFRRLELQNGLPSGLMKSLMMPESGGDPAALSKKSAAGLFQFIPKTAELYNVDPWNPHSSADGAARLLGNLHKIYNDNTTLSLAAYNWGEGNLGVPPRVKPFSKWPDETQTYVANIWKRMGLSDEEVINKIAQETGAPVVALGANPHVKKGLGLAAGQTSDRSVGAQDGDQSQQSEGETTGGIWGFIKKGPVGNILGLLGGGGLGLMIGKFLGGFFNDGSFLGNLMGMCLTAALTIGGALMGANKVGGWLNGESGSGERSPEGQGHSQGRDVNQPAVARTAAVEKVGSFTAEELQAVVSGRDLPPGQVNDVRPDKVRLEWQGSQVKLKGVLVDDTDTKGVVDVAPMLANCMASKPFDVVRKNGSEEVEVVCMVPKPAPVPQASRQRS